MEHQKQSVPQRISLVECPRDAMQGWPEFIPTSQKIAYLNTLLKVGFDVLDFGSFVSPKAIPQMADTAAVMEGLDPAGTTRLLAIVANLRGADQALEYEQIRILGFPFSISETFQQRNTNKSILESTAEVEAMLNRCAQRGKELVVYISMGFGNPYADPYSPQLAVDHVSRLADLGVRHFALSDTVGVATPPIIQSLFNTLVPALPECTIGAHFHSTPATRFEKLEAAWNAGCRRFDSAILGIGGCPMAKDDLVGNMATEALLQFCDGQNISVPIDREALSAAQEQASAIFQLHPTP